MQTRVTMEAAEDATWSALGAGGWVAFNAERWQVSAHSVRIYEGNDEAPLLETILYRDKKGRITGVPHTPYLPLRVRTRWRDPTRDNRQRLRLATALAELIRGYGTNGFVTWEPSLVDFRPFQWSAFDVEPRYTYLLDLPAASGSWGENVRKACRKAESNSFRCERTTDIRSVTQCLDASAARQRFTYQISAEDLARCSSMVGEELLRLYLCRDPEGRPASARVILHRPGSRAIDFLAGTDDAYRSSGATQMLTAFALDDLAAEGATGFDYAGANIPSVAQAKADWGGTLTLFYAVRVPGVRSVVDATLRAFDHHRRP